MDVLIADNNAVWFIVKLAVLFALVIYIVFAFVIMKQVKLMTDTLELGQENLIRALSYAHLMFSIGVFLFALVIL